MYVITFYSFRGSLERTTALVNVGAELARRGRKVLLVDFDLESPALQTFELLCPTEPHQGLTEYINRYLETDQAPPVVEYFYRANGGKPIGDKGGQLWVMPAGLQDSDYRLALARIDWRALYREHEGFLFFEDTKLQWQEALHKLDYVLIDSPGGYSAAAGICTRQFANALALFFVPEMGQAFGLREIWHDVRTPVKNGAEPLAVVYPILVDFCPDPGEGAFSQRLAEFCSTLEDFTPAAVLHQYHAAKLPDGPVPVLEKPQDPLAKEYQVLADQLISNNHTDREVVLDVLRDMRREPSPFLLGDISAAVRKLQGYADRFWDDAEVLAEIAEVCSTFGCQDTALSFLEQAAEQPTAPAGVLFQRAMVKRQLGREAADDLMDYLRRVDPRNDGRVLDALRVLKTASLERFRQTLDFPAIRSLAESGKGFGLAVLVLLEEPVVDPPPYLAEESKRLLKMKALFHSDPPPSADPAFFSSEYISEGRCAEAIKYLVSNFPDVTVLPTEAIFDLAMASWVEYGQLRKDLLNLVRKRLEGETQLAPWQHQMLSLACWGLGDIESAEKYLGEAEEGVHPGTALPSFWRYGLDVDGEIFHEDCALLRAMIAGGPIRPFFFERAKHSGG